MSDRKACLTAKQVAHELHVDPDTVRAWATSGQLSFVNVAAKQGGRPSYRFTRDQMDEFVMRRSSSREEPARPRRRTRLKGHEEFYSTGS